MANKKIITVTVRNKIADGCGTELVCDNSDYRIRFDLDSDWDGINAKTARLLFGTGHYDFPFTGNEVDIDVPIPAVRSVTIGVFAGDIKTSTPAFFKCRPSVKSSQSTPTPPPPEDVYNKIMELIEGVDDAILEVDELPAEGIDPSTFYRVGGKLYYRVGDKWAEITTDFFDYVKRGEYDAAIRALTDSLAEINEGVDGKLTAMGESLKATDDKAVVAHNKAVEVNTIANNALSISSVALQSNRDEVQRATEVERILQEKIDNVEGIAKGANSAVAFGNYQTMVASLNAMQSDALTVGQNVMIVTLNVPDLWVAEKLGTATVYSYTSDEDFVAALKADGSVQVGYFKLAALETQKVDIDGYPTTEELNEALSAYVKNTDYATEEKAGVVKAGKNSLFDGIYIDDNGQLLLGNDIDLIKQRAMQCAIRNQDLDLAVIEGITNNERLLTEDEKAKATEWLGIVKATDSEYGLVKIGKGLAINPNSGVLYPVDASIAQIKARQQNSYSIVPNTLDYAVMCALSDPIKHTWSPEEKGLAQKTLGVGEWIEATKQGDNYYRVAFKENGVYEYYIYLLDSAPQKTNCYANTIVFDRASMTSSIEGGLVSDERITICEHLELEEDGYSEIVLTTKEYEGGHPQSVVFKARKIREI